MPRGFTLVEMLVVLLVMGLATALVAPALLPPAPRSRSGIGEALHVAREAALRRAETIELEIAASGHWALYATASPGEAPLATDRLDAWEGGEVTIVIAATGTCGFDARSLEAARRLALQPFTCELATP